MDHKGALCCVHDAIQGGHPCVRDSEVDGPPVRRAVGKAGESVRINVYSQELTDQVAVIEKVSNTGLVYSAVQLMLHSSPMLHHPPADDDRSAVTFWLPKSPERRQELASVFERMAELVRAAREETGLD
jgi:hypothetical protein